MPQFLFERMTMNHRSKGFTLIELLIVVAIIAILAAIAVPNFLEAQTRAKVSRVLADLRSFATAQEAYHVDYNKYIDPYWYPRLPKRESYVQYIFPLTTPVPYITSTLLVDPFSPSKSQFVSDPGWKRTYWYATYDGQWGKGASAFWGVKDWLPDMWMAHSYGPDRIQGTVAVGGFVYQNGLAHFPYIWLKLPTPTNQENAINMIYDPTNGTVSLGDIGRFGGDTAGLPSSVGGGR
jgi:prepilin-type N-terminal cleavage/methylation domain-containing protein